MFQRAATQIAKLKGKVDVILAETDTCPQNRYSTGAMSLHTHFTGTILEGANGAKHWITRLITHEPQSGKAYRRILSKYNGFYERLAELTPSLKWRGCRIHTPKAPDFTYGRVKEESDGWSYCVLERLGIPMYFSGDMGGVLCLEGDSDTWFTNDEIKELLKCPLLLASDTAENLINRGFGKYLGVDVRQWTGKPAIRERISLNGGIVKSQMKAKELVPLSADTKIASYALNTVDNESYEELFAGSTIYKNELGGIVFTFCGTPVANFDISEAFSFLSYSRKEQLVNMLKMTGELPLYYKGDEEVYLKCADTQNGETFCALFNLGFDPIDKIELGCEFTPSKVECLTPDGEREELSFTIDNQSIIVDKNANTLEPVILFIQK